MSPVRRDLVEFVSPQDIEPRDLLLPQPFGRVSGRPLSGDPEAGNGAALVDLPGGWTGGGTGAPLALHAFEVIALDGRTTANGVALGRHGYVSVPAGEQPPLLAAGDALGNDSPYAARLFVDFVSDVTEALRVPASEDGWTTSGGLVPGPPPGLSRKQLRGELGVPCAFLLRVPAGWREDRVEWHDCAEACICLDGDLWHDRANRGAGGVMRRGSYFWRPQHVLHSPMGSETGCELFITVDGELYNHYLHVDGPPPGSAA